MAQIRKLVVAVVGLALMFVHSQWGVDLTGVEGGAVEAVIGVLTAIGVYQVPNAPKPA